MTPAEGAGGRWFTPLDAAAEVLAWLEKGAGTSGRGLTPKFILDPTCGNGRLLQSAAQVWPEARLTGFEVHAPTLTKAETALEAERASGRLELLQLDFLLDPIPGLQADLIFGNPPWLGFSDLPRAYKTALKPVFQRYGLTPPGRQLLLGASRIDVAALVIAKALRDHLLPGGTAVFFAPRSLLAPGAHQTFADTYCHGPEFRLRTVWNYGPRPPFPEVATAHGLLVFERAPFSAAKPKTRTWNAGAWREEAGLPHHAAENGVRPLFQPVRLPDGVRPRQGLNAGGTHDLFVFPADAPAEDWPEAELLYPLLDRQAFQDLLRGLTPFPRQLAFLPLDRHTGTRLPPEVLQARFQRAWAWVCRHRARLEARRGTLMAAQRRSGVWYGLLGVGAYTFRPWKIIWEAYGKQVFRPVLVGPDIWVPNQALFCSLDFESRDQAEAALEGLNRLPVTEVLTALGGAGRPSWAQPGRMAQFFTWEV